jgi:uncharacterized protein (TIGR03435 family)
MHDVSRSKRLLIGRASALALLIPVGIGVLDAPFGRAQGQVPAAPRFEVTSIRPNRSGSTASDMGPPVGDRFIATNVYVKRLIRVAYNVQDFQIQRAPAWIETDRYDIAAKTDLVSASLEQYRLMLQSLLTERFRLSTHRETKEMPIFALKVARSGPRIKDSDCPKDSSAPSNPCKTVVRTDRGAGSVKGQFVPMTELASILQSIAGHIVVDRTNLTGSYDIDLNWSPDLASSDDLSGPSLLTAIREQLGLELQSTQGPVEVLVIDHVERPSEN